MNKTILLIAFDFLPSNAASVQRTLSTFNFLNEQGWSTIILTANESIYQKKDYDYPVKLNNSQFVYRAKVWDVQKHFSIKGKYFPWMKIPDRWNSWILTSILKSNKIIKRHRPDLILSTTPIPSAHVIAAHLAKKHNIPWVAEYRDPPSYIHRSKGKWIDYSNKKISNLVIKRAKKIIFASNRIQIAFQNHHQLDEERCVTIRNGYNEDNFKLIEQESFSASSPFEPSKYSLYYCGFLYGQGRDPQPLFKAIGELKKNKLVPDSSFELVFQGAGDGDEFKSILNEYGIQELVRFLPPTPFLNTLKNMTQADTLVLIQDAVFNLQIPSKLFEYIRSATPVLAITPQDSASAELVKESGCGEVATTCDAIQQTLARWLSGESKKNEISSCEQFSRKSQLEKLDAVLTSLIVPENK